MADHPLQNYLDQIPENYRHRKLDDDHRLADIANNIPDWKTLADYLSNIKPSVDVPRIVNNNQGDFYGQTKALLRLWLQRNGHQATYSQLVRVMHRAKMIDTIDALLQVLRDTPLAQQPPQPQQQVQQQQNQAEQLNNVEENATQQRTPVAQGQVNQPNDSNDDDEPDAPPDTT